ncbi:MAG TPA: DUF1801 domain-containing protein [Egibacteraceae bacterium]|nr:DUF1801 domain-containing protein [Egibacteraceae bacterium]
MPADARRDDGGGRDADAEALGLLSEWPQDVAELARWLRSWLLERFPEFAERVYRGWGGLGYHHPGAGYVCAIFPASDRVRLGFERGARLDDPHKLLYGQGLQVRYLDVASPNAPSADIMADLVEQAIAVGLAAGRHSRG